MTELDGFQLHGFFRAGSVRLAASRVRIDRMNVFPVPDGDTGTNLVSTLSGAVEATVPSASAAETLARLADAALESARGNSGAIFAQFVGGLSEAVRTAKVRVRDFADGIDLGHRRARSAIEIPRDGTMISVMGDWSASLARLKEATASFDELFSATSADLRRSLEETRDKLPELKAAGVVDAGAVGFVEFLEGGHAYLRGEVVPETASAEGADPAFADEGHEHPDHAADGEPPRYRYCAEAMVAGTGIDAARLREALHPLGDSLIVAGNASRARIHVHTDRPDLVVDQLARFGAVYKQKADDMAAQYRDAHAPRARTAIVTDSACDLPAELLEAHGVHVVPLLLEAGGTAYLDKVTLARERFWDLAEKKGVHPKSSMPPSHFFSRLYAYLTDYYESVVSIHLASALSGTYGAAAREASKFGDRVVAADSRHLSGSLGLLVLRAAEAAEAGATAAEIAAALPAWAAKARNLVSVSSLRYMVKGGRVSPLKGWLAKVLNLKPIVSVDDTGRSVLYGKAFSEKANHDKLVRMAADIHRAAPLRSYAVAHAKAPAAAAALAARLEAEIGFPPMYVMEISSVVALNAGPGAVSVVTLSE